MLHAAYILRRILLEAILFSPPSLSPLSPLPPQSFLFPSPPLPLPLLPPLSFLYSSLLLLPSLLSLPPFLPPPVYSSLSPSSPPSTPDCPPDPRSTCLHAHPQHARCQTTVHPQLAGPAGLRNYLLSSQSGTLPQRGKLNQHIAYFSVRQGIQVSPVFLLLQHMVWYTKQSDH